MQCADAQHSTPAGPELFARALEPSSQLRAELASELHALHGSLARQAAQLRDLEDGSDADCHVVQAVRGGTHFLTAQSATVRRAIRHSRQVQGPRRLASSKQREETCHRRAFKSH